jgi:hypothetical protein
MIPIVDVSDTPPASGNTKRISINNLLSSSPTASGALTVTGLVTAGSATITGDLTVDTSTLKVDSTNNRVGIGTATPVSSLQVLDGDITATTANVFGGFNGTRQTIPTSQGTQLSRLHFSAYSTGTTYAQGASIQSYTDAAWSASSSPATLSFYTTPSASVTPSERMKIEAAGDVTISTGNVVMATSGKGIDFSATTSGSGTMTSELLNDYEEGTWTPVIADATTGGNVGTVTINSATYTKIGRQVSIQCDLRSITTTGMTGANNLFIRGLPFTSVKGGNGSFYTYRVGRNASTVSSAVTVEHNVSLLYLSLFTASSANTNLSILVSDITSGTSELALSVTYTV